LIGLCCAYLPARSMLAGLMLAGLMLAQ